MSIECGGDHGHRIDQQLFAVQCRDEQHSIVCSQVTGVADVDGQVQVPRRSDGVGAAFGGGHQRDVMVGVYVELVTGPPA
ncbi:hypothetical protein CRM89_11015 [Nocardia sp. FDAARGOS_372]|nr:hypothetical protein CRM89_11015 [Nocardia sp. FDAARGOS_372]